MTLGPGEASKNRDTRVMDDLDSLWDFADPHASEQKFRDFLAKEPANLEALTQLARSLGLQRQFDEASKVLDTVEQNLDTGSSRARVRYLLERGRTFNSSKRPDEALPLFNQAVTLAREIGEGGLEIDAMHMVAIADPERSLEVNLEAITRAEASEDPRARKWLASLYNNTGWSHFDRGEVLEALTCFEQAVPLREAMGDLRNLVSAKWCVARMLRELGRQGEAVEILQSILPLNDGDAYIHQELALCYDDLGVVSMSIEAAKKALEIFSTPQWEGAGLAPILERLRRIADTND